MPALKLRRIFPAKKPCTSAASSGIRSSDTTRWATTREETLYFGGQQWDPIVGYNPLGDNMNNGLILSAAPRGTRTVMFETLYMYNGLDGKLYPLLADGDYTWNDDLTELTLKIKSAAKWSDGTPVTARRQVVRRHPCHRG